MYQHGLDARSWMTNRYTVDTAPGKHRGRPSLCAYPPL
ncbi:hypothetical protein HRUBRA_00661 [Pseudohaliea rubra DSM 19751]|uniref:Uncharacterized protein n=1 Tax=Pseudohaliea rubra DSM 19751 TaxID=1265313 RepID=A0A095VUN0_9GAMM|nr:hypothetical protein HRUBRA_00661 [Pseudohaliea rubra DSM 19751]